MDAASALQALLERSGLTKKELSERSGVSRSSIDHYLRGERQPSVAQLERLGRAAGQRLDLTWTPRWAAEQDSMAPAPLSIDERARVLEVVVAAGLAQQRRPRGDLEMPSIRRLRAASRA